MDAIEHGNNIWQKRELTVPHANGTINGAAAERILPKLQATNVIVVSQIQIHPV